MNEQKAYGNNSVGGKKLVELAEELSKKHEVAHGRTYDLLIHAEVRLFMNNPGIYFMHMPLLRANAHTMINKYLGISKVQYNKGVKI